MTSTQQFQAERTYRLKKMLNIKLCFFLLFYLHVQLGVCLEHDGVANIILEHALVQLKNPVFTERGNVTIQSLRLGQVIVNQNPPTDEEQKQLRDLAANNDLYQIKATVTSNDGSVQSFLSTVKACMLAEAKLDDQLSVSLDYSGRVIGVTLVIASKSTCEGAAVPLTNLKQFTTNVYVRYTEIGPVPDTASYIQKLEKERESKEKGETKDNKSFLAKYWMFIIPVVLIMAISSASNPEGGQQAQ